MGLLLGLQNEAERVQRRADQQVALGNRRVTKQNAQVDTLKGEMAPLEEILKHYNTQVAAYNASAQQVYVDPVVNRFETTPGHYETRYNRYLRPDTAAVTAATAADTSLKARQGDIDALNASGKSIERRNGLMAQRAALEAERFNTSIDMQKRAIQEAVVPQQSTSVFDQNMAGIHQSISDWLNA